MVKKSKATSGLIVLFITLPIWFYIQYWILSELNPDRLIWFLFWIYVPSSILVQSIIKFSEDN